MSIDIDHPWACARCGFVSISISPIDAGWRKTSIGFVCNSCAFNPATSREKVINQCGHELNMGRAIYYCVNESGHTGPHAYTGLDHMPMIPAAEVEALAREIPCHRFVALGGEHCDTTPEISCCIACGPRRALLALCQRRGDVIKASELED